MSTEIVKVAQNQSIIDLEPEAVVERAMRIAKALRTMVQAGGMISKIQGKDYVQVEGWNAMGSLMGFVPKVVKVVDLDDGGFEAHVDICTREGQILSSASALVGMDEPKWAKAPAFSRRSMAITRATGKAYRIGFSWVMSLAELSVTPAEDMPGYEPKPAAAPIVVAATYEQPPHPASQPFNGRWPKKGQQ